MLKNVLKKKKKKKQKSDSMAFFEKCEKCGAIYIGWADKPEKCVCGGRIREYQHDNKLSHEEITKVKEEAEIIHSVIIEYIKQYRMRLN